MLPLAAAAWLLLPPVTALSDTATATGGATVHNVFAYGAAGVDGVIPPFTDLDFEVHLMAINGRYNKDATAPARSCSIM